MSDEGGMAGGGNILDRYINRRSGEGASSRIPEAGGRPVADDGDAPEDLGSFGWLRGVRDRAVMLELRKADGHVMAVGYGWLERAEFEPTNGITLYFPGRTVRIKGQNLNGEVRPDVKLFHGITRHRVPWILQSRGRGGHPQSGPEVHIASIEW